RPGGGRRAPRRTIRHTRAYWAGAATGDLVADEPTAGRAPTRCLFGGSRFGRRPGAVMMKAGAPPPTPARGENDRSGGARLTLVSRGVGGPGPEDLYHER